jgi:UDP-glucose:(glucosyl)LPS alpha-1,2-glucosyltransferase
MSVIYKGEVINTDLSRSAMGGTEQMRSRLINNIDHDLLKGVAIHLSRVRKIYDDVPNIFWAHDLPEDAENNIFKNEGWKRFVLFVFVSAWQRDMYINKFGIPYSVCRVIENAIEPVKEITKANDKIKLIYHTTPHRGLELLYPVFDAIATKPAFKEKLHLDVFSSFEIYGWKERDKYFEELYSKLKNHPNITYHGAQANSVVREYLSRAHYFPYPCIWKETSCIALIEAIEHKVLAIHPNYGALTETAGKNTLMYDYTDDIEMHVNKFYFILNMVLEHDLYKYQHIDGSPKHRIQTFISKWSNTLKELK